MVLRSPSTPSTDLAREIAAVAVLDDPVRTAIFLEVARSGDAVTRDQAAKALRITRRTAAFHLDKLAEAGLVDVSFKRVTGRTGPGAGRSSKLYRRSGRRLNVSIPARNYELMARLLASVAQQTQGDSAARVLEPQARAFGASKGAAARRHVSRQVSRKRLLDVFVDELSGLGFEPFTDAEGTIRLRNCPYHDMARENTDFVCSMNLALMQGMVEGLDLVGVSPAPQPKDGMCCVAFRTRSSAAQRSGADVRT